MVELYPAPFTHLVERMYLEYERQKAVFDLPQSKWYLPAVDGPNLSVCFHGQPAGTPIGPASGPHNQMAQNLAMAWLAGSRILELKTVQINDRLQIPRPCIDAATIGYNVEWSQELRIGQSLGEYVAGAMLIKILRQWDAYNGADMRGPMGDMIFDLSVGYDLAGIRSPAVVNFIEGMKNAKESVDALRLRMPARHARLRDLDYPTELSRSITLSTFHGCPADEIERICTFLLTDLGMNVIVKMNPPMLGKERLEHLLHEVMGYTEIAVNPTAYASGLQFNEAVDMCRRLDDLARKQGRCFGAKFSNTLEVLNHRTFFTTDNKVMYLSGPPLHVITLTLAGEFRKAMGPGLPFSFSAGVDARNCADVVAAGFLPVTTCTDLLKPGGYARLPKYLTSLSERMAAVQARTIDDFVLDAYGQRAECGGEAAKAGAANLALIVPRTQQDERYWSKHNRLEPKRVGTHLVIFDCVTCDKCVPVCPNDANFIYDLPTRVLRFKDWVVGTDGKPTAGPSRELAVVKKHQIANYADFCNECGNCDAFCPEYGGPFIEKPSFFGTLEAWERHADHDGFFVECPADSQRIHGRIKGQSYVLDHDLTSQAWCFQTKGLSAVFVELSDATADVPPTTVSGGQPGDIIDMHIVHTLRLLLEGILAPDRVHQANTPMLAGQQSDT